MDDTMARCVVCNGEVHDLTALCDDCWKPIDEIGENREDYLPVVAYNEEGEVTNMALVLRDTMKCLDLPKVMQEMAEQNVPFVAMPKPAFRVFSDLVAMAQKEREHAH